MLIQQRETLYHRGPDDSGVWWSGDGCVGLAHRRLAIIDLSPMGHQPMMDTRGCLCLVFNGEIYNFQDLRRELEDKGYVFRSDSDTEVILAGYREWDAGCVQRLNGMFSFALYDTIRRRLFMARDRAGEKPLYYAKMGDKFVFSSELKALMHDPEFPRRVDPESLDCYLAFGYVPGERCIFRGVNKLPPAHALIFETTTGRMKIWRYYGLPEQDADEEENRPADPDALAEELEYLLEDSVRRQLVSDVPVGILLSGGMDSSLVTAMAARAVPQVNTYTIRFPGCGRFDETEHARLIARHFGTNHSELDASMVSVDLLKLLIRQFDEPMADDSMIPTFLVSRLAKQQCTVALGGDGGDELFGGYAHYSRILWMREKLGWIPPAICNMTAGLAGRLLPWGFKGRSVLQELGNAIHQGVPDITCCFDLKSRLRLLDRDGSQLLQPIAEEIRQSRIPSCPDLLQRATRMDFENYLAEDILVKVDRASMLNSLEVRAPFLDYRIIDFAYRKVPSNLKATSCSRKILLKKLADRVLPPEFDKHRKQGFCIPMDMLLRREPWKEFFRDALLGTADTPFNRKYISGLLTSHSNGISNSTLLFTLGLFELWRKEYAVSL
ncbi:MAG: asparagine synthase (glutamine-hydrolyzing) [Candidatus Latescibacterota bacterium]